MVNFLNKTWFLKKLLGILVLGLLLSGNAYADENALLYFNQYLKNNGYNEYIEEVDICKELKKNSKEWFSAKCENYPKGRKILRNKLDIKIYTERKSEIPYQKNPNRDTLLFYVYYYLEDTKGFGRYLIEPSKEPLEFNSNLREDKFVKKQLQKKAILSYLYFEDDQIIVMK